MFTVQTGKWISELDIMWQYKGTVNYEWTSILYYGESQEHKSEWKKLQKNISIIPLNKGLKYTEENMVYLHWRAKEKPKVSTMVTSGG